MQTPLRRYWQLLGSYLRSLWRKLLLLGLVLAAGIGLQLVQPRLLQRFIDAALGGAPVAHLSRLAGLFLLLAILGQLVSVWATYLSQEIGWRATNRLRADLTDHALNLDLSFHTARSPGEMVERIDGDVTVLANLFSQCTVLVLSNGILLVGVLAILFAVDWRAGLALGTFAAINLATLLRIRHVAAPGWQAARQSSAAIFGFLGERLSGMEDIRANGAEIATLRGFALLLRRRLSAELEAGRGMALMLIVSFGLIASGIATAFAMSAYLVTNGLITVGTAYMIFHYTELLRRPIEQLAAQVQDLARASASITRIDDLLGRQRTIVDGGGAPLPQGALAVGVHNISFGYGKDNQILHDVTFSLAPGRVLGLVGRTGSGKSTLARLLARLYDPAQGSVRLGDVDLRGVALAELRHRVCVVTQDVQLFHGTLRDNLTLYDPAISDSQIWESLAALGVAEWAHNLPDGLDTPLSTDSLSAGEAQLLALARAFLRDPGLLILDEPSSRLDPATEQRLERALDRLLCGRTAVVIAHRLSTLQRADEILELANGRVVEHGARSASRFARLIGKEVPS